MCFRSESRWKFKALIGSLSGIGLHHEKASCGVTTILANSWRYPGPIQTIHYVHLPSFEPLLLEPCNIYAPFFINYIYPMDPPTSTATVFVVSSSSILQSKSFVGFGSKDHRRPPEGVTFRLSKSSSNGAAHRCCCLKQHHEITTTTKNSLTFVSPTEYSSRASPYSISITEHCHD